MEVRRKYLVYRHNMNMINILYKQKVRSWWIEIFERHLKFQADLRKICGHAHNTTIYIG